MRRFVVPALLLALVSVAACAGPRLTGPASTAHLPEPVVLRLAEPPLRTEGVAWPVVPETQAVCDT